LALGFRVQVFVFQRINGRFYSEVFPSDWKDFKDKKMPYEPFKTIYLLRQGYHFNLLKPPDDIETLGDKERSKDFRECRVSQWGGGGGIDSLDRLDQLRNAFGDPKSVSVGVFLIILFLATF
jgi:hypothetical protein